MSDQVRCHTTSSSVVVHAYLCWPGRPHCIPTGPVPVMTQSTIDHSRVTCPDCKALLGHKTDEDVSK